VKHGGSEGGAGAADAHHGVGVTVAHEAGCDAHRGVALGPHGLGRVLVHADDLRGRHQRQPGVVAPRRQARVEQPLGDVERPDQHDLDVGRLGQDEQRAVDDRVGSGVAAEQVEGDARRRAHAPGTVRSRRQTWTTVRLS
jgi:hypothetical protein